MRLRPEPPSEENPPIHLETPPLATATTPPPESPTIEIMKAAGIKGIISLMSPPWEIKSENTITGEMKKRMAENPSPEERAAFEAAVHNKLRINWFTGLAGYIDFAIAGLPENTRKPLKQRNDEIRGKINFSKPNTPELVAKTEQLATEVLTALGVGLPGLEASSQERPPSFSKAA